MLTIEYEQSLVETAVFLSARRNEETECELHLAIDPLYQIPDEELRQREFVSVFRAFFARLGLDRLIIDLLAERPIIGERVDRCVVREAPRTRDESAELFVRGEGSREGGATRTLVIQVCPQSFIESEHCIVRLRRELLHVADMLDERFGYRRETFSGPLARRNLQRDRYRVLWDAYAEGRLQREGRGADAEIRRLRRAFDRVFPTDGTGSGAVFRAVFDASLLTHRCLLNWACDPGPLLDASADREPSDAHLSDIDSASSGAFRSA